MAEFSERELLSLEMMMKRDIVTQVSLWQMVKTPPRQGLIIS
jgi:hypothetical protein